MIRIFQKEFNFLFKFKTYWFSKRGLPWGTRENSSFLSHRNYASTDGIQITSEAAEQIIHQWTRSATT